MKKERIILSVMPLFGMAFGYAYYRFYGCSEVFEITGNPWRFTLYFGILFLLGGILVKDLITKKS
jgi:hypothetical protein